MNGAFTTFENCICSFRKTVSLLLMRGILTALWRSPSRLVIVLIIPFIVEVNVNQGAWKNGNVIRWDVTSYYSYLPAAFIDKDIKLSFINDANQQLYLPKYVPLKAPNGNRVIKGSMGMAVMYAPFFFAAHAVTPAGEADGYGPNYQLAIQLSGLLYFIIGLFCLRRVLLRFFPENITAITLAVLYFATNLLCYTTLQAAMSHQYIFFLFSVFIYYTVKWYEMPRIQYALALGLSFGLMLLVRPVNLPFFLFFMLYGISSMETMKMRFKLLLQKSLHLLLILVLVILIFLPQLFYFKYVTGQFFFNSYIGEWFYFTDPHLAQCLLGFRKGWLIYTPVMVFALAGIFFLRRKASPFFWPTVVLLPLYFYILASWWCWWYGGSFGLRAMIDLYPLLAFSLAAFFSVVLFRKKRSSKLYMGILVFFILLNCFQTIQFHYNIIHYDGMTRAAYFNSFGKTSKADCDRSLIVRPDYERARLQNK